jgi:hypothetical protein
MVKAAKDAELKKAFTTHREEQGPIDALSRYLRRSASATGQSLARR